MYERGSKTFLGLLPVQLETAATDKVVIKEVSVHMADSFVHLEGDFSVDPPLDVSPLPPKQTKGSSTVAK